MTKCWRCIRLHFERNHRNFTKIYRKFLKIFSEVNFPWKFNVSNFQNFFWKIFFYDFLWMNVSVDVHNGLVFLPATFSNIEKRQILGIAQNSFQINRFYWLWLSLRINLKTFLMNSKLTVIALQTLFSQSPNKISTMSAKSWLLSKFLDKNRTVRRNF